MYFSYFGNDKATLYVVMNLQNTMYARLSVSRNPEVDFEVKGYLIEIAQITSSKSWRRF